MATEIALPPLGKDIDEGAVVAFAVKVGDHVSKGAPVFEVEADKATLEVASPADGFVKHILVSEGQTLRSGQAVLILGTKNEHVPQDFLDSLNLAPIQAESATSATEAAIAPPEPDALTEPALGKTLPQSRLQKITAERMLRSKRDIPCFYLTVRTDVTDLVKLRAELNKAGTLDLSYNAFLIRAVALGLEKFPVMAGRFVDGTLKLADSIDVGLAVALPDGLVVPVVRNANNKTVTQIARDSRILVETARANKLKPADLEHACITVSNLGSYGIESFIPIVIPGQCSILGVGRIVDTCLPDLGSRPGPSETDIAVRKLMTLTLSVDHRITNGSYAAQFLDFAGKLLTDSATFQE